MLHDLARIEINKLEAHGVTNLTYDEVASLQSLAEAVDVAVRSEGLPVGITRPLLLCDGVILYPLTLAASSALEAVMPWIVDKSEVEAAKAFAWLMAHGRDLAALDGAVVCRSIFHKTVVRWARALPVTPTEFVDAVNAVFDAEDDATFRVDVAAFETVARHLGAMGEKGAATRVRKAKDALVANRRQKMQKHIAKPNWGAMTLRLAAITGCDPDAWSVKSSAEAIEAYTARIDFAAMSSGLAAKSNSAAPEQRAQLDALKRLWECTDAIARAHKPPKRRK